MTDFVRYEIVDRNDRKIARFMYVNRDATAIAADGFELTTRDLATSYFTLGRR